MIATGAGCVVAGVATTYLAAELQAAGASVTAASLGELAPALGLPLAESAG